MTERRFTFPGDSTFTIPASRQRSWAECYAVTHHDWSSCSDSERSGRNSLDQSNVIDLDPPDSSSSSSSSRASRTNNNRRSSSSSSSSSAASVLSTGRHVLYIAPAPSTSWNNAPRPSTPPTSTARLAASPEYRHTRCWSSSQSRSCQRRRFRSRERRRFTTTRIYFRRESHPYQAQRHWGHLPVAIPSDRWYTGVGSLVCAQCQLLRRYHRTSWMCLQCEVPLCLLAWRNCYSQWHSGE